MRVSVALSVMLPTKTVVAPFISDMDTGWEEKMVTLIATQADSPWLGPALREPSLLPLPGERD